MDLMLSLSQHCGPEGGLAQQSAPGGVVGGGWGALWRRGGGCEERGMGGSPRQTCKGTNINLATASNLLRKCSPEGGLARLPVLLYSQ